MKNKKWPIAAMFVDGPNLKKKNPPSCDNTCHDMYTDGQTGRQADAGETPSQKQRS